MELTQEEIKIILQLIMETPLHGNMRTLPPVLEKLVTIQEKLTKSLQDNV